MSPSADSTPMKTAYVAWAVRCKTAKCACVHVLKYIGQHDGRPTYILPDPMPGWFDLECPDCDKVHRYNRGELEVQALSAPPPPEFVDRF